MTTALLLAAGQSRRFGAEDKLLAPFRGAPLVSHAAKALARFERKIAVVSSPQVRDLLSGFEIVQLDGDAAQSRSLQAGVAQAPAAPLLVTLGDMPLITAAHLVAVVAACPVGGVAASHDGSRPMPPACFDPALFPELLATTGDQGAGPLLRRLACPVPAPPDLLADVDTPGDLAALDA